MFSLPMFTAYDVADWLTTKTGQLWDGGLKLTGLRDEAAPEEQPAPQGFYVDALGHRTPIDPETGYPMATRSESQDIRADLREPAIKALQEEARAMGKELPQEFLNHMRFCENPLFPVPGVEHQISIFQADGTLFPNVHESIKNQIASGELEKRAAERVAYRETHDPELVGKLNPEILNALEEMNGGMKLPEEVRQALINDRQYEYITANGQHRQIDLTVPDIRYAVGEIRELAGQFLNGKSIDISEGTMDYVQHRVDTALAAKRGGPEVG